MINYLGRYSHKIAISNSRIISYNNGFVTFKWRDYRDKNAQKLMTISATEFMRRFLLHVLPEKFVKIRYFGIVGTRNRKTKLLKCQMLTGVDFSLIKRHTRLEIMKKLFGDKFMYCPHCGCELMSRILIPSDCLRE